MVTADTLPPFTPADRHHGHKRDGGRRHDVDELARSLPLRRQDGHVRRGRMIARGLDFLLLAAASCHCHAVRAFLIAYLEMFVVCCSMCSVSWDRTIRFLLVQ